MMLNNFLGPNDIQIGSWYETIKSGGNLNKKAFVDVFFSPLAVYLSLRQVAGSALRRQSPNLPLILNSSMKRKYSAQLGPNPSCPTAAQVSAFDPKAWSTYFKFAFVRNPYDFEVSDYFWRTKTQSPPIGFKEFLRRKLDSQRTDSEKVVPFPVINWPIYTINDTIAVSYVGRFESLANEVKTIGHKIGLPLDINAVPRAKNEHRIKTNSADLYDDESKEMVSLLHKKEIDYFKYTYPF